MWSLRFSQGTYQGSLLVDGRLMLWKTETSRNLLACMRHLQDRMRLQKGLKTAAMSPTEITFYKKV